MTSLAVFGKLEVYVFLADFLAPCVCLCVIYSWLWSSTWLWRLRTDIWLGLCSCEFHKVWKICFWSSLAQWLASYFINLFLWTKQMTHKLSIVYCCHSDGATDFVPFFSRCHIYGVFSGYNNQSIWNMRSFPHSGLSSSFQPQYFSRPNALQQWFFMLS